jgi:hypothetical protein
VAGQFQQDVLRVRENRAEIRDPEPILGKTLNHLGHWVVTSAANGDPGLAASHCFRLRDRPKPLCFIRVVRGENHGPIRAMPVDEALRSVDDVGFGFKIFQTESIESWVERSLWDAIWLLRAMLCSRKTSELCCILSKFRFKGIVMSKVVYVANVRIERKVGPLRIAYLPGEAQPVLFSVHGAIAEHYKVSPESIKESHAATIDYVIAGVAG